MYHADGAKVKMDPYAGIHGQNRLLAVLILKGKMGNKSLQ